MADNGLPTTPNGGITKEQFMKFRYFVETVKQNDI